MDDLTAWEFVAAVDGWKAAHCEDDGPGAPTAEEHAAMIEKHG